jgi:hypothetical protein
MQFVAPPSNSYVAQSFDRFGYEIDARPGGASTLAPCGLEYHERATMLVTAKRRGANPEIRRVTRGIAFANDEGSYPFLP